MKKHFAAILALSAGLLSASAAQANDAVLGAVIGGGLGAVVGNHVSGRDGAIIGGAVGAAAGAVIASEDDRHYRPRSVYVAPPPVRVYSPAPVYGPAPIYAPAPVYYAPSPVRVVQAPVVYVPTHPGKKHWRHEHRHYDRNGGWR